MTGPVSGKNTRLTRFKFLWKINEKNKTYRKKPWKTTRYNTKKNKKSHKGVSHKETAGEQLQQGAPEEPAFK